jgi:hypothetical protein
VGLIPDPGVLHGSSRAKYIAAFFKVSFSSFRRAFSHLSLSNSSPDRRYRRPSVG